MNGKKMVEDGKFRLGVGMIVCNTEGKVLWAKRSGRESWQFPQGGMLENEAPEATLYRELEEEVGLTAQHVQVLGQTKDWLTYEWPEAIRFAHSDPHRLGQKQKWFLLKLVSEDTSIYLDNSYPPEFENWRWVDYWYPLDHVVDFKKELYQQVLHELVVYRS